MFSVIIPLYNKANAIKKTINSVLNQTVEDFEIIVVNDGSTDSSYDVVAAIFDIRLRLITQENNGVSSARNLGIQNAKYEHLIFLDGDDLLEEHYLEKIKSLIFRYPEAGAFGTRYYFEKSDTKQPCNIFGMKQSIYYIENYFKVAANGDLPITATGVCIPREVLNDVGTFPTDQVQGEDQDLWSRIGLKYPIVIHPDYEFSYVQNSENRVSIDIVPDGELGYSKELQLKIQHNEIPQHLVQSVKKYIAGHLINLAELNIKAGNISLAKKLLADPRTNYSLLRKTKWSIIATFTRQKKTFLTIENLLKDSNYGGIMAVIDSYKTSNILNKYQFNNSFCSPSSWLRKNYQSDIIIVHYESSWKTIPGNIMLRIMNPFSKIILQEHHYSSQFENNVPSSSRFLLMLKVNYMLFNRIVTISKNQDSWIRAAKIVNHSKISLITQCRNLENFLKIKQKNYKFNHENIVVGAFGRLCHQKGFDQLIKGHNKLSSTNVKLIIGGDGPSQNELKLLAKDNKNIAFLGRLKNVPEFLAQCDLVIIPSRTEPFGLVCLEAKASATPVIVSDIDGLSEQVSDCGLKITNNSPDKIHRVLKHIKSFPLQQWGKNGRAQVKNAWQNYEKEWMQLLDVVTLG